MDPHVLAELRQTPQGRGAVSICGSAAWAHSRETPGTNLSTPTQAPPSAKPHASAMLWSDPDDEPPKDLQDVQNALRRLGILLALVMLLLMIVLGVR